VLLFDKFIITIYTFIITFNNDKFNVTNMNFCLEFSHLV